MSEKLSEDETAWLIEETWSGYVHYVAADFDAKRFEAEAHHNRWRDLGEPARNRERLITKDANEAMRFPTREAAEAWLASGPAWLRTDQFQAHEHMWSAALNTPTPTTPSEEQREDLEWLWSLRHPDGQTSFEGEPIYDETNSRIERLLALLQKVNHG